MNSLDGGVLHPDGEVAHGDREVRDSRSVFQDLVVGIALINGAVYVIRSLATWALPLPAWPVVVLAILMFALGVTSLTRVARDGARRLRARREAVRDGIEPVTTGPDPRPPGRQDLLHDDPSAPTEAERRAEERAWLLLSGDEASRSAQRTGVTVLAFVLSVPLVIVLGVVADLPALVTAFIAGGSVLCAGVALRTWSRTRWFVRYIDTMLQEQAR